MKQLNNSLYKPSTQRNANTKVCFLMTNAFTCRSSKHQNISALMKLATLKQQHKQYHLNLKTKMHFPKKSNEKQKQKCSIDKIKQGFLANMPNLTQRNTDSPASYQNYNGNNDKFIEKPKDQQTDFIQSKKYNYSCLEKCRMATQSYDQLKMQIINKIKIKRSRKGERAKTHHNYEKQKLILFDGVIQKDRNKQNQILIRSESIQKNYLIRENRYRSQSDSHKKAQRYNQISVADFMDQPQSKISGAISKKFDQFRKTYQKQSVAEKIQEGFPENQDKIFNQINPDNRSIEYPLNSFSYRQKITSD